MATQSSASVIDISEFAKPQSVADAHRLKSEAARERISAKYYEARGDEGGALMCLANAAAAEETANRFLAFSENSTVGAGGELMPSGKDAAAVDGLVDTMKNPDRITESASRKRIDLADKAGVFDLALDMSETIQPGTASRRRWRIKWQPHIHALCSSFLRSTSSSIL